MGVLDKRSEVSLADATNGVDVGTAAVVLGQVSAQTKPTNALNHMASSTYMAKARIQHRLENDGLLKEQRTHSGNGLPGM